MSPSPNDEGIELHLRPFSSPRRPVPRHPPPRTRDATLMNENGNSAMSSPRSRSPYISPGEDVAHHDDEEEETRQGNPADCTCSGHHISNQDELAARAREFYRERVVERRVVWKFDLILLPFLSLLFLLNSLDKSNIGNAETAHFTRDAHLSPDDLNTAVAAFYTVFVALQPVGAALGRRYGMARYVPACMAVWGMCTGLHVWVGSRAGLVGLRVVIGVLEAGFYPTTVSYLSLFYTRYEFARRLGLFYGQSAVAGALGGVLSYLVFKRFPEKEEATLPGDEATSSWKSWQVLFLIEGATTMVVALIGFLWLPHSADTAWFLNKEERQWAEERIRRDVPTLQSLHPPHKSSDVEDIEPPHHPSASEEAQGLLSSSSSSSQSSSHPSTPLTNDSGLTTSDLLTAFTDWKIYYILLINILSALPSAAFSVFLPLIVSGLGYPSSTANLLSAPPFLLGALTLWCFTAWSDARKERLVPVLWGLVILLTGLTAVVMLPKEAFVHRYIALCVLLSGSFVASPLTVAWLSNNTPSPGKRAVVLGINGWGNLAGVVSALLFRRKYAPEYVLPFFVTLGCVMVSFVGYLLFRNLLVWENAYRRKVVEGWTAEEVERERRYGDVPLPGRRGRGVLDVLVRRGWFGRRGGRWVEEWRRRGREGDQKMTFLYGL